MFKTIWNWIRLFSQAGVKKKSLKHCFGTFFCWYERRYTSWHSMYCTIFVVLTAKSSMFIGNKKANFPEYSRTFIRMTRLECHVGGCFHMPPCSSDKSIVWSSFEHPQSDALKNQLFFWCCRKITWKEGLSKWMDNSIQNSQRLDSNMFADDSFYSGMSRDPILHHVLRGLQKKYRSDLPTCWKKKVIYWPLLFSGNQII